MNNTFDLVFNKLYKKYYKKDYFSTKQILKNHLSYAKLNNIQVKPSQIKEYLRQEKLKCYDMMLKRLNEYTYKGKTYPKREKFTNEFFKMLKI